MSSTHSTTVTYVVPVTLSLPRTIVAEMDPQTIDYCTHAFWRNASNHAEHAGGSFPFPLLTLFANALVEGGAVTCMYTNADGTTRARTLFPSSIALTADNRIAVRGWDSFRAAPRTLRLDRVARDSAHLVTLPGEIAAA